MEPASEMHGAESGVDREESSAPTDETYRSHFASWLGGMSEEARKLAFLLEREEASAPARRLAADSLNQLLHAADLIPEGTEALGYLETLFAFRVLAAELSEPAFSAQRLPKPRPPKLEPAVVEPVLASEPAEEEPAGAEVIDGLDIEALSSASAEEAEAELGAAPVEGAELAEAEPAAAVEASAEAAPTEGEPLAAVEAGAEEEDAQAVALDGEAELEPPQPDLAEAAQPEPEKEEEEPLERAQASDESHAVVRRLAAQAALVRAFLGAEDAERLRTIVLQLRNRASRGRTGKQILFEPDARAAAASDARDWAELYEVPEFGTTQHDLLRLRTFMRTRVRRVPA